MLRYLTRIFIVFVLLAGVPAIAAGTPSVDITVTVLPAENVSYRVNDEYSKKLAIMVKNSWNDLPADRKEAPETADHQVVARFLTHSDGEMTNLRITRSSGFPLRDAGALSAIQTAGPYPKFAHPDDLRTKPVDVTFDATFQFHEE